jgi:hypothetical protein
LFEANAGGFEKGKPGAAGSHTWSPWLRDRLENSNYILLRIPVEIHLFKRGLQNIRMDPGRLRQMPGLSDEDIERLGQAALVRAPPPAPQPKARIDYVALQQTYVRLLSKGGLTSKADVARHLDVSRVRVSRVLKGITRKRN